MKWVLRVLLFVPPSSCGLFEKLVVNGMAERCGHWDSDAVSELFVGMGFHGMRFKAVGEALQSGTLARG